MAVYPQVVLPDPIYLQTESYSAQDDRRGFTEAVRPGCGSRKDHKISFVSGRTVRLATGISYIKGRNIADQGFYRLVTTSTNDVTHNPGDGSNPRIDQVVIRVMDNAADGSGFNEARMEAIPGTPTGGATLDNRSGALNLDGLGESSKNYLLLADVLVPTGAATLLAGNIRDRRSYCFDTIPDIISDGDIDTTYPTFVYGTQNRTVGSIDLMQGAALVRIPRPIKQANHFHWGYRQGGTAITGQYIFALYDASGRLFCQTSATSFTGAASSAQRPMLPLTTTLDIDAGMYYLFFGIDSTNAGTFDYHGAFWQSTGNAAKPGQNIMLHSGTGGVTLPTTLAAFGDALSDAAVIPGITIAAA